MRPEPASPLIITPELDRRNGRIFVWTQLLIYFSAPVLYVGVVQAAFCDQLGASATVANLPSSTYLLGAIFPMICAWLFPPRLEQKIVKLAFASSRPRCSWCAAWSFYRLRPGCASPW